MIEHALAAANTHFAFKLFAELAGREPGKNIFISPASVALALAMAANGAAGETRREMQSVLELGDMRLEAVNEAHAGLMRALTQLGPGVRLAIASSLWGRRGIDFNSGFLDRSRAYYQAAIEEIDFADPNAPDLINAWVREHTEDKIEQIVDKIPRTAILYLLNAIYFKGDWEHKFDERKTEDGVFHLAGGGPKQLPMMWQRAEFPYYEAPDFQAILLPYAGGRLSMCLLLPRKALDIGMFEWMLGDPGRKTWLREFRPREGTIALPRFKLEYEAELGPALRSLGMVSAFERGRANFLAMCDVPNVGIDKITHKTFVEANEEGTEAAAVTSVRFAVLGMIDRDEPFRMVVDRPFFCAILDNQSRAILFMGAIMEP
jgi:serpin B